MKTINAIQAHEAITKNSAIIIDVREQAEFDQCRIAEAHFVPLSNLPVEIQKIDIPLNKSVIFQCLKGGRSAEAIMYLENGYLSGYELYNLEGGIIAWAEAGLPIEE